MANLPAIAISVKVARLANLQVSLATPIYVKAVKSHEKSPLSATKIPHPFRAG